MDGWGWAWIGWGLAFLAIEVPGLVLTRNGAGTLSEHVWHWFATAKGSKGPLVRTRRLALLIGLAWLCTHFLTGGWV